MKRNLKVYPVKVALLEIRIKKNMKEITLINERLKRTLMYQIFVFIFFRIQELIHSEAH